MEFEKQIRQRLDPRYVYALQMQFTENSKQIFPEMKLRGLFPNFYFQLSVSDLFVPTIGPQRQYSKIGRPIVGIYKSLTYTLMQKLGATPSSFISGTICFELSVQCGQWTCLCILILA
jgi:hypothetical protein